MPTDLPDSQVVEALRHYPDISRSQHPILSFTGLGLDTALESQTLEQPYGHIAAMMSQNAWVLLMGTKPSQNFSLHYAEQLAGRKQFTRWALTPTGIVECPHFSGCPEGFHKVHYHLEGELHKTQVDDITWYYISLDNLISVASNLIKEDPYTLLCNELSCKRCNAVRRAIRKKSSS
jgi:aminoglycoside 3-N-acetyltransferase